MALLFTDPYEGAPTGSYSTVVSNDVNKWTGGLVLFNTSGASVSNGSVAVVAGLSSPKALRIQNNFANWAQAVINLGKLVTGVLVTGFLYDVSSTESGNTLPASAAIFQMGGSITANNNTSPTVLYVLSNGSLRLNGVTSAAGVITGGSPAYIEVVRNVTTGAVTVFVNDVLVLTSSVAAVPAGVNVAMLATNGLSSGSVFSRFDDIYVLDDSGSSFNARLGPVRFTKVPLAASVGTPGFTPQGGAASNLAAVNKDTLSETTFNRSPTANNQQDVYSLDASGIVDGTQVMAVDVRALYRKTSPGPRNLALKATNGATVEKVVTDRIATFGSDVLQLLTAPDGSAWDKTKLTATTVAYEVRA